MIEPPSPQRAPLPSTVAHPVKTNSDYEEIDVPSKPSAATDSTSTVTSTVVDNVNGDDEATSQEPLYSVVKKPSPQPEATAASCGSASPLTTEQPTEVTGYQIERVTDSPEEPAEVSTPPRTKEMETLVESSDSGSFDDAVYEVVD